MYEPDFVGLDTKGGEGSYGKIKQIMELQGIWLEYSDRGVSISLRQRHPPVIVLLPRVMILLSVDLLYHTKIAATRITSWSTILAKVMTSGKAVFKNHTVAMFTIETFSHGEHETTRVVLFWAQMNEVIMLRSC